MNEKISKMDKDYDHILNIDHEAAYQIAVTNYKDMITIDGRNSMSLNGQWHFTIDVYDTGIRKKFFAEVKEDKEGRPIPVDFSFENWPTYNIPGDWNHYENEYTYYEGNSIFVKDFLFQKIDKKKYFLRIGASNYETKVFLNKKLVGRHLGGFTPFFIDITDTLLENNRIVIMVNNSRKLEQIPSINYDWFNYGGITRDVEIIEVPNHYIKDYHCYLVQDGNYNKIGLSIELDTPTDNNELDISIPELGLHKSCSFDGVRIELELNSNNIKLWSPENPKLYDIIISCNEDCIKDQIGFRQIEVNNGKIMLNGSPIFLKGICYHEESCKNGRAVTEDDMIQAITDAKELNCNYIRLTHYPHHEKFAKLADRLGIMLWEEIPVYWALKFEREDTFKDADNQLRELIIRDRNRASVVIWSIGNENPDSDERLEFMRKLSISCRELDPNRLVSAACLVDIDQLVIKDRLIKYIDIVGINEYYGWYYREFKLLKEILSNSKLNKPIIISETGGEAVPKMSGDKDEIYTEDCQEYIYRNQIEIIQTYDSVQGMSPWILYDYKTGVRLNHYQNGVNLKGIISMDRKHKKRAYYTLKSFYMNC